MFYIIQSEERPNGYVRLSTSNDWVPWLALVIPNTLNVDVRHRLKSNLKHIMVGLELKAALIEPHEQRAPGQHSVLFEPYFQNFIAEFCVGAFSVVEGLGAAQWLAQEGFDGANAPAVYRNQWRPVLASVFDETDEQGLNDNVTRTLAVRDKLHQDQLGARENIDWHTFSHEAAFMPARRAIATLLLREADSVPGTTNLR